RIAIHDGFTVLRDPAGKTLPDRDLQRREQAEVVAGDELRHQTIILLAINRDGVVRNKALQANRQHRKSFVERKRVTDCLAELEQHLRFLTSARDGRQELHLVCLSDDSLDVLFAFVMLKSGGWDS